MDVELGASTFFNGSTNGRRADNKGGEETEKGGGGWRNINLAYRTLGVVFGGLVTSPLYVYPSMNLKSPIEEDYLGIYSIMFWTLTLIGVVKYASIALNADDHGEGGTFALYSLLCRHTNIGLLPSTKADSDTNLVHPNPCSHTEKSSRLGTFIEQSITARRILLFISMLGMCMLIGDGILTPAISVLSAIDGLRGPLPAFGKSAVEAVSAVILIGLFLLQKYGTSRVSFLFSPIMAAWTFTTPIIGIYSFLHYYPGIFKSISPHYIIHFFLRNGKEGWKLLGGTVLCITGAEAMFADLGHFNKRSIQIAFLFTIYPSLVLTYTGQTTYLIRYPDDHNDGFYKFVPTRVYWPMFIIATLAAIVASRSLISATFSVIKQSVVLDYFPRVNVVHTSQHKEGEVYSSEINYILIVLCVAVILGFGDGKDIGNAFGAEAMFADLGHFNKRSIQIAFLFTIFPLLVLTYAGQTAYLIRHPDDHNDGFYKFVPTRVCWPMFIIATLAAIVAGQSLISATFSVIKQSVVLDYFPRVKVVHTSQHKEGEVYSPEISYFLIVLCVAVILGFGDGKDIGNAFGVVVIMDMLITTILLTLVMIIIWRTPLMLVGLYFVPFFVMEGAYVNAVTTKIVEGGWFPFAIFMILAFLVMEGAYVNAVTTKIVEGGWFPFAISMILAFVMFGWYYGRQRKIEYKVTNKITLDSLAAMLSTTEIQRVQEFTWTRLWWHFCFILLTLQTHKYWPSSNN